MKTRFIVFFLTATQCFLAGCNPRNIPQRREPQDTFPTNQQPLSSPTSRDTELDRGNTDRNRDDIDRNRDNDREQDNNDRGGENRSRQKKYGVNSSEINREAVRGHEMRLPETK